MFKLVYLLYKIWFTGRKSKIPIFHLLVFFIFNNSIINWPRKTRLMTSVIVRKFSYCFIIDAINLMVNLRVKTDKYSKAPPGKSFVQSLHSTNNHRKYYSIGPNNEKWLGIKEINARKATLRISWWDNYSTRYLKINLRKIKFFVSKNFFP